MRERLLSCTARFLWVNLDLNVMFGAALGLAVPWQVVLVEFDPDA